MSVFSHVFIEELIDNLDPHLKDYYEENKGKNKFFSKSLHKIVEELVQDDLGNSTEQSELRKAFTRKTKTRNAKKNRYLKKCQDMIDTKMYLNGPDDKYFLKDTLIHYNMTAESKRSMLFEGMSFEEKEQEKFHDVAEWAHDENSFMIDYPGEDRLTANMIANNYKSDVSIEIYKIIKKQYGFDLNRATYAVMDDLRNQPIFAAKSGSVNVSKLNGDGSPREIVIYKSEDHSKKLVISLPEQMKSLDEDGSFKIFDQIDNQILSYLLNNWEHKPSTSDFYGVKVLDILKAIRPKRKGFNPSDYENVVRRIERMYEVGIKDLNKNSDEAMRIISSFRYDRNEKFIFYAFDPFYMDKSHNLRIRKMSSTPLTILSNNAAKILYASFMEQRRNAYKQFKERGVEPDEYVIPFAYNFLLYYCNFGEENKKKSYHEDIIDALDNLKENHILIKDYQYLPTRKIYKISFYPLSEDEIKDFDYYYNIKELPIDETLDEATQINLFIPTIEE